MKIEEFKMVLEENVLFLNFECSNFEENRKVNLYEK